MDKREITPTLARRLVASQFPEWADLPVTPVELDGWDNTTFRLGADYTIRLPSAAGYEAQVEKEQRWLPELAPVVPVAIPVPAGMGRPGCGFPRRWSIYRWIDGEPATAEGIADLTKFARDLADFLVALQAANAEGAPGPGAHNFGRGGPLDIYDRETRDAIDAVARRVDPRIALEVWEAACASRWDRPPVWIHGDVTPSNLLTTGGRLGAVIDFGCCAGGDPACDLVMAWTFFGSDARHVFRQRIGLDDATWARARGWALWKALITLAHEPSDSLDGAAHRFGWRIGIEEVIGLILDDHRVGASERHA